MVWIIIGVIVIMAIGIWKMCVVAGDADSQTEEMLKKEEENERERM